ncbi:MAG: rRNA pseudouridine synthase [Lachnospiraceae bacterium]|nr:rRNA pseudouridine synthase [Lachnospiraceae bacterium]MCD8125352.1 rRNA pseudouridine synthase [Lachnospiraceae bacterium]
MRLDRFLSEMGVGSRREIRDGCRRGIVTVNGTAVRRADISVSPDNDVVCVDGTPIHYAALEYYMLNKPAGVVTAVTDAREKTVLDLLPTPHRKDLFPVGRLDKDTEGLLLITNDGPLCQSLLSPRRHVEKTYFARVQGRITSEHIEQFRLGLDIGDERPTLPAGLEILRAGDESEIQITITEGRFHQVKRMVAAVGGHVLYLKRLSMGPLQLDPDLDTGACRKCTPEEIFDLKQS